MSDTDQQIGEEMLTRVMQYCDGALDAHDAEGVAREIAASTSLQALAADLKLGANAAREVMGPLVNQPVPIALARSIVAAPAAPGRGVFHRVIRSQIAAILVGLLIGAAVMGLWSTANRQEGLRLAGSSIQENDTLFSSEFRAALLSALRAQPALAKRSFALPDQAGAQGTVSVIKWFDLSTGTTCAEFTQEQPSGIVASGIACQRSDGGWELIALPATRD